MVPTSACASLIMIKYCFRCKKIYDTENNICSECGKKLVEHPAGESPVAIITTGGFELERVKAALEDEGIPCSVQEARGNVNMKILNNADNGENIIMIPLAAYNHACDVLIGIGAMKPQDNTLTVPDDIKIENTDEEMSPRKRFWVRAGSIVLFIIVVWLAITATDIGISLVKKLFAS